MQPREEEKREVESPKQAPAVGAQQADLTELREEIGKIAAETGKLKE